jgi:hypothetical protein
MKSYKFCIHMNSPADSLKIDKTSVFSLLTLTIEDMTKKLKITNQPFDLTLLADEYTYFYFWMMYGQQQTLEQNNQIDVWCRDDEKLI